MVTTVSQAQWGEFAVQFQAVLFLLRQIANVWNLEVRTLRYMREPWGSVLHHGDWGFGALFSLLSLSVPC